MVKFFFIREKMVFQEFCEKRNAGFSSMGRADLRACEGGRVELYSSIFVNVNLFDKICSKLIFNLCVLNLIIDFHN